MSSGFSIVIPNNYFSVGNAYLKRTAKSEYIINVDQNVAASWTITSVKTAARPDPRNLKACWHL